MNCEDARWHESNQLTIANTEHRSLLFHFDFLFCFFIFICWKFIRWWWSSKNIIQHLDWSTLMHLFLNVFWVWVFAFFFLSFFIFLKKKSFLLGIEWWSDDEIRNEILGHLPTPSEFHLAVDEKNHFYSDDDDDDESACKSSPVFQFFFLVF